jgi:hypothetical protein
MRGDPAVEDAMINVMRGYLTHAPDSRFVDARDVGPRLPGQRDKLIGLAEALGC